MIHLVSEVGLSHHPRVCNVIVLPESTTLHCMFFCLFGPTNLEFDMLHCFDMLHIDTLLLFCCIALICYTLLHYFCSATLLKILLYCHIAMICYTLLTRIWICFMSFEAEISITRYYWIRVVIYDKDLRALKGPALSAIFLSNFLTKLDMQLVF
jgi:hypothetical protein